MASQILVSLLVLGAGGLLLYLKVLRWRRVFESSDSKVDGQALEDALRGRRVPVGLPQIAGSKCSSCRRRIVAEKEALQCSRCAAIIHRSCADEHQSACAGTPVAAQSAASG